MPVTKRSSKAVSCNESDDDDDFIPIVDISKKNRINKSNETVKVVRKHEEKPTKEEPKKPLESVIIESTDKENSSSQSTVSSDDDEISSKNKRMKHDASENEDESAPVIHPNIPSVDLPASRTRMSDLPKRDSSIPIGFPTSKINISSPHVSRVGLSRKSLPIKPLHPNLTPRVVPE